jgi:hypothetical protein
MLALYSDWPLFHALNSEYDEDKYHLLEPNVKSRFLTLFLALNTLTLCSQAQKSPPATPGQMEVAKHPLELDPPSGPQPSKLDPERLRLQADELSKLAQSIPADVAETIKGKVPAGLGDKLKRIEKLSKQIRGELAP